MAALVDQLTTRFALLGEARSVEVVGSRPDGAVLALGQPDLIERALANIVHNAVRHNEAGGHVSVVLEARADGFLLAITDDGPGVPPEDLPRLTGRSFRADASRQRDPTGAGLGLAIASEVFARAGWQFEMRLRSPAFVRHSRAPFPFGTFRGRPPGCRTRPLTARGPTRRRPRATTYPGGIRRSGGGGDCADDERFARARPHRFAPVIP